MGCSGGGFVRDCFEDGMLAVGLEGSDYSKKFKRAEWRFIPEYLFTCDVTSPFELFVDSGKEKMPLLFDVVTSWELIEHIAQKDLPAVINNVKRHLVPNGMWILSVSMNHDIIDGVDLHQTVQKKRWWIAFFEKYGLRNNPQHVRYFQDQFIRGPRYGAPNSFHLVLTRNAEIPPLIPRQKLTYMIYDAWHNSFLNRLIKTFLIGK